MQRRATLATLTFLFLLIAVQPALAAQEDSVFLPGWFAWSMVALAIILPVALFVYLRGKGRL